MSNEINLSAGKPSAPPRKKSAETNVKEVLESILVAFILAFVFRAFVVEAFVIPTGSMAPTLLGAHMRYTCDDCGYSWTVNFSAPQNGDEIEISSHAGPVVGRMRDTITGMDRQGYVNRVYAIHCPNCGYRTPRISADSANDATNPPTHYGDRILVLKYLYLFSDPKRWDVVVFKSPAEPGKYDYQQNYIKRLIGRPGESIMLLYGNVFAAPGGKAKEQLAPPDFSIARRPRAAQDACWRPIVDNDYLPRGLSRSSSQPGGATLTDPAWEQPWKIVNGSGWTIGTDASPKRDFAFNNLNGPSQLAFDPAANLNKHSLTDWLAYDVTFDPNQPPDQFVSGGYRQNTPLNTVGDLKLSLVYERTAGEGPLTVSLSRWERNFIAEILPGSVSLFEIGEDQSRALLGKADIAGLGSKPTQIDFLSADYRVSVRVNDREVVSTTDEQYSPNVAELLRRYQGKVHEPLPTIAISADRQACNLSHVSLWRGVYLADTDANRTLAVRASPFDFPNRVASLNADEYLCCGDNNFVSYDGRYWPEAIDLPEEGLNVQAGVVPKAFLLGKAFFVYWPAGYRPTADGTLPGLIPNFGQMRFIH